MSASNFNIFNTKKGAWTMDNKRSPWMQHIKPVYCKSDNPLIVKNNFSRHSLILGNRKSVFNKLKLQKTVFFS